MKYDSQDWNLKPLAFGYAAQVSLVFLRQMVCMDCQEQVCRLLRCINCTLLGGKVGLGNQL